MKLLLQKMKYSDHNWQVSGDFKLICLLLGQQLGFTKFSCFICEWNSRDRGNHYTNHMWPRREGYKPGEKNIIAEPVVSPEKVLLPPLHIKLGIVKNFLKALDKNGEAIEHLKQIFYWISDQKIKEGMLHVELCIVQVC